VTTERRLYAIVDVDTCLARGLDVLEFAQRVCEAGPLCVQLRAKNTNAKVTLDLLRGLVKVAKPFGVPVYANDRPDLAMLSGADGVHVGQDDMPVAEVRALAPELRVGLSTHDDEQVREAITQHPDYIAIGPIFPTPSKIDHEGAIGLLGLESAAQLTRAAGIPLVAIGGIDRARVRDVAQFADWVSVIGALVPSSGAIAQVTGQVKDFASTLSRAP